MESLLHKSQIWTSKNIDETLEKLKYGFVNTLDLSAFFLKEIDLKAANVRFQLTHEELEEFNKCSSDIEYFVETYCKFLTDTGQKTVKLRDYQEDILSTLGEEIFLKDLDIFGPKVRNYILMSSRQTGKTTSICAFFSWYLCFHTDRNLAILANKEATTKEIVRKVIEVFRGLPFFLKPGINILNVMGLQLDNGCTLFSQATTITSSIGFTIHVLYIDEFAHIPTNITKAFWRSVYPTLASSKVSQCIISSTPFGMDNLFYEIWDKANRGENDFIYKRVDWWEVPEHDDIWAEKMKRNFGEEYFAQEFDLQFDITTNNLLSGSELAWMKRLSKIYGNYEFQELEKTNLDDELYENLIWTKDFDINRDDFNDREHRFIISIDLAEGKDEEELKDNDYNVAVICQIKLKSLAKLRNLRQDEYKVENMFRFEQVGLYRDNIKDEVNLAKVCQSIVFDQIKAEIVKLIVEMNFNGKSFVNEFARHNDYFSGILMHSYHTAPVPGQKPPRKKIGFKTRQDKNHFCKLGKRLIREKTIIINEKEAYSEFSSFGRVKKNNFKGIGKHDDIVMASINISRITEEPTYRDWLYDFLEELEESPSKRLAMTYLKNPIDKSDINDEMFHTLYDSEPKTEKEMMDLIYKKERKDSFTPGFSFSHQKI